MCREEDSTVLLEAVVGVVFGSLRRAGVYDTNVSVRRCISSLPC